jgi:capsular exopolysaccharide synthesis family protein
MFEKFSQKNKNEKTLLEILYIVYRGKFFIITFAFLSLILAYLYNQISTPIYESTALLKKEVADYRRTDELSELVRVQTMDRLETEMQLIKTGEVLYRVIDGLKLRIELQKIVDPTGKSYELKDVLIDHPDSNSTFIQQAPYSLPKFNNIVVKNKALEKELYVVKVDEKQFELKDVAENKLISSLNYSSESVFDTLTNFRDSTVSDIPSGKQLNRAIFNSDFLNFEFSWDDAPVGSKIYFNIVNNYQIITNLNKIISVSRVGRTDVFELSVSSSSPAACKLIADQIINSFREVRMEQQKQKVSYSFHFVDDQLTEVQKKLLIAERNLSDFKGTGQIMNIDKNTQELLNYQSTLEAERLQTDLLLSNYKDKSEAMLNELKASGYFDQSFLQPLGEEGNNLPFTSLMTQLSDLEMQRLELLQKHKEKHPDVKKLDEQIQLVKEKLASYNQNTLTAYKILINTLEKKLQKIDNLMSNYEVKLQQLPSQETQMARLVREKEVYEKIFKLLLDKREEMRVAELSQLQDIIIVDPPYLPYKPIKPRKLFNMAIALFLGGFIGIVSVFLVELRKTRLIDLDYLESEFKIPVLALIPKYSKDMIKKIKKPTNIEDYFVSVKGDNLGIRESFRLLETKLLQLNIRDKIILITSCEENSGKSSTVANLAFTMAQNNKNILVIDCDLRKANLSKMFGVFTKTPGLIDFINNGGTPAIYNRVMKQLNIIPAGGVTEKSGSLLSSERMKSLFNSIDTSIYDYIIIDTPPVTRVVDTLALGQFIKNAILVVRPDLSIKETGFGGIQDMTNARIKIRGIIGNAVEIQKSYHYKYRYGYGYGYSSADKEDVVKDNTNIIRKSQSKIHKTFKIGSN